MLKKKVLTFFDEAGENTSSNSFGSPCLSGPFPVMDEPCARCGVELGMVLRECEKCQEKYCPHCRALNVFKNPCESGGSHSFGASLMFAEEENQCSRCGGGGTLAACAGFSFSFLIVIFHHFFEEKRV